MKTKQLEFHWINNWKLHIRISTDYISRATNWSNFVIYYPSSIYRDGELLAVDRVINNNNAGGVACFRLAYFTVRGGYFQRKAKFLADAVLLHSLRCTLRYW